jgi:hypothetical protein
MGKNEQQMRRAEAKRKQEARRLRSERLTCPRREAPSCTPRDRLHCPQAEESRELLWHSEELDADWPLVWRTCIARQALCPPESQVGPLRPRKDRRRRRAAALAERVLCKSPLDGWITQAACRPVDALSDSCHARGGESHQ